MQIYFIPQPKSCILAHTFKTSHPSPPKVMQESNCILWICSTFARYHDAVSFGRGFVAFSLANVNNTVINIRSCAGQGRPLFRRLCSVLQQIWNPLRCWRTIKYTVLRTFPTCSCESVIVFLDAYRVQIASQYCAFPLHVQSKVSRSKQNTN